MEVAGGYCSSTSSATTFGNINVTSSAGLVDDNEQMQQLPMNHQWEEDGQSEFSYYHHHHHHHQHFNYDITSYGEDGNQLLFQEPNGYCYYGDNSVFQSTYGLISFDDAADPEVDASIWNELEPLLPSRENRPVDVEEMKAAAAATTDVSSAANHLTKEVVARYFHMPITQAAKEMNVGLTLLKKRCREIGVKRWPHRKLKSLRNLIANVKQLAAEVEEEEGGSEDGGRAKLEEAIRELENERKVLDESPDLRLGPRTMRLRQACFKATYKRKRKMNRLLHPSSN